MSLKTSRKRRLSSCLYPPSTSSSNQFVHKKIFIPYSVVRVRIPLPFCLLQSYNPTTDARPLSSTELTCVPSRKLSSHLWSSCHFPFVRLPYVSPCRLTHLNHRFHSLSTEHQRRWRSPCILPFSNQSISLLLLPTRPVKPIHLFRISSPVPQPLNSPDPFTSSQGLP